MEIDQLQFDPHAFLASLLVLIVIILFEFLFLLQTKSYNLSCVRKPRVDVSPHVMCTYTCTNMSNYASGTKYPQSCINRANGHAVSQADGQTDSIVLNGPHNNVHPYDQLGHERQKKNLPPRRLLSVLSIKVYRALNWLNMGCGIVLKTGLCCITLWPGRKSLFFISSSNTALAIESLTSSSSPFRETQSSEWPGSINLFDRPTIFSYPRSTDRHRVDMYYVGT